MFEELIHSIALWKLYKEVVLCFFPGNLLQIQTLNIACTVISDTLPSSLYFYKEVLILHAKVV